MMLRLAVIVLLLGVGAELPGFGLLVPDPFGPFASEESPAVLPSAKMARTFPQDCAPGQARLAGHWEGKTLTAVVEEIKGNSGNARPGASRLWLTRESGLAAASPELPWVVYSRNGLLADLNGDGLADALFGGEEEKVMKNGVWKLRPHVTLLALSDPKGWALYKLPGDGLQASRLRRLPADAGTAVALGQRLQRAGRGFDETEAEGGEEVEDLMSQGNFQVFHLAQVNGTAVLAGNSALPGFPMTIADSFEDGVIHQNHEETKFMGAGEKKELLEWLPKDIQALGRMDIPVPEPVKMKPKAKKKRARR